MEGGFLFALNNYHDGTPDDGALVSVCAGHGEISLVRDGKDMRVVGRLHRIVVLGCNLKMW